MKGTIAALNLVALCIAAVCMLAQPVLAATAAVRPELTVAATATGAAGASKAAPSEAEAVYEAMVAAWQNANSIYYESDYESSSPDARYRCKYKYKIWLLKPNSVRLEVYQEGQLKCGLVGDGSNCVLWWKGGPPQGYAYENSAGADRVTDVSAITGYMTHATPAGRHSIASDASQFGIGLALISDPSMFCGTGDPAQQYIDSGRLEGTATVAGEKCDVLHLYLGKANRETTLWVSQADHLPRKAKQVIRGNVPATLTEAWSGFKLNGEVAKEKLAVAPQEDWRKIRKATMNDEILQPGTVAPEFNLAGVNGDKIKLSDYKGKVVWLHIWFAG